MTHAPVTYEQVARSFNHELLSSLPAYPALRCALSDLAGQAGERGIELAALLDAVRDMAATTPYGDTCERCERLQWPHAVERDRGWLDCTYRCPCRARWTCGYVANITAVI